MNVPESAQITGNGGGIEIQTFWELILSQHGRVVIFGAVIFLIPVWLAIYRIWFHPLAIFPGPKRLAVINFPQHWKMYMSGTWIYEVTELHAKYGPIVRIGPNHLAIDGAIGWPQVFGRRNPEFGRLPKFFHPKDRSSILAATKQDHRRQRKQLSPAFSDSAMKEQEGTILKYVDLLIEQLGKKADTGEEVNLVDWFNFTTFDIIGDLMFAKPFDCLESNDFHPWVLGAFRGLKSAGVGQILRNYPYLLPFSLSKEIRELFRLQEDHQRMSSERARARMALGPEPEDGRDIMTYALGKDKTGAPVLSDMEILTSAPIFILAGSETTATALSGLFFFLSQNPEKRERLTKEIRSAISSPEEITMRAGSHLEYTNAFIEETLRLYPPAVETPPRLSPGDQVDGKFVPKGTAISVYQWATHRNPKHFAEPASFHPERWLPKDHALYDPIFDNDNFAACKPFSFGSRDCIGKNLAYAEMRVIICRMLYHFDLELLPGQQDWLKTQTTFIIWDKGPLKFKLRARKL